ncbi:MAG: glycosyltransferase family 2 protein [Chlorobium sp.]|nr:glycosyltransferase family 2 protein [Chlorobium sp.]
MVVDILFWFSFSFIVFTYVGYPLILLVLSRISSRPVSSDLGCLQPFASIVVAAKNEAHGIGKRLNNLLEQDYPADKLEIIIVSDGSSDDTVSIIQNLVDNLPPCLAETTVYDYTPSKGKPTALNIGVELAKGEIIVFADSRQQFEKNTVSQLVSNFSDPTIGAVSGELVFLKESDSKIKAQMGAYWIYEKTIRKMEGMSGSVVGVTGAVYAIRKKLYQYLPPETILDDVLTPMNIIMQGYRVIFDSNALAYDSPSRDVGHEWKRKVRTLAGNWQLISLRKDLLNPFKDKLMFRFFFHKIARLLVPGFLVLLLITSILQSGIFFGLISVMQILVYLTALLAHFFQKIQHNCIVKTIYFFCSLNFAAIAAFFVWSTGRISTIWIAKDVR